MRLSTMPSQRFPEFELDVQGAWHGRIAGSAQGSTVEWSMMASERFPHLECGPGRLRWGGGLIVGGARGAPGDGR